MSGVRGNTGKLSASLSADGAKVSLDDAVRSISRFTLNRAGRRRATIGGVVYRFLNHRSISLSFVVDDISQEVFDLFFGRCGETLYVEFTETTLPTSGASGTVNGYVYKFNGPMQVVAGKSSAGVHQYTVTVAADRTITEERLT